MIISCPNCASRFEVPTAALGTTGRQVRCSSCQSSWHQEPIEDAPEPAPEPADIAFEEAIEPPPTEAKPKPVAAKAAAQTASDDGGAKRRSGRGGMVRTAVWLSFAILVLAIFGGAYRYRQALVDKWPAATVVYETVGISVVPPPGYSFSIVREKLELEYQGDGVDRRLVVRGVIANISDKSRPAPQILVFLQNDDGKELKRHNFAVGKTTLGPGENVKFMTSITGPPPAATKIQLRMRYPVIKAGS